MLEIKLSRPKDIYHLWKIFTILKFGVDSEATLFTAEDISFINRFLGKIEDLIQKRQSELQEYFKKEEI